MLKAHDDDVKKAITRSCNGGVEYYVIQALGRALKTIRRQFEDSVLLFLRSCLQQLITLKLFIDLNIFIFCYYFTADTFFQVAICGRIDLVKMIQVPDPAIMDYN